MTQRHDASADAAPTAGHGAQPDTPADLVVVGAGPAGLAAAVTALVGGLRVALVDAGAGPGGQYWRHPAPGEVPLGTHLHHDLDTYEGLTRHVRAHAASGRLRVLAEHDAWAARATASGIDIHVLDRRGGPGAERADVVTAPRLLIATGAYDRQLPFPGWDLPGVYTAGGLQSLLKGHGVRAGDRVVVAGTGPFLLPVATGLAQAGARVVAVCEANSPARWARHIGSVAALPGKAAEGAGYAALMARHRIGVTTRAAVVAAHGRDRLDAVTIARLDGDGRVRPGSDRRVEVDTLGVGWGFVPQLDLAMTLGCTLRDSEDENQVVVADDGGRSSVPGVYVAGEVTGVGGATLALREGQLAGEAVLADSGRPPATSTRRLAAVRREVARHRAFARALRLAHPVPRKWPTWLTDETLLCRCEEVDVRAVRAAVAAGAHDGRQVKQLTRVGMGWCQGRMCAYAAHRCAAPAGEGGAVVPAVERLVATPVPLGALARTEPS